MTGDTRVAAIVVAYNGGDDLLECLQSLLAQSVAPDLEVIVVDNASTDGSVERAESAFGDAIRVIRRTTNGGYAAGANTGWRATDAPIVAILNQDLTFAPDCLEEMRRVLLDDPRDALVTPKLLQKSDPTRVNAIGNDVHLSGVAWCHGLGSPADDWHGVVEVTAISGAAFMTRRSLLARLGGLEEAYVMYLEDVDLSLRARLAGGTCLAACDAIAVHDWQLRLTPWKFGLIERNRSIMWKKLFGDSGIRTHVVLMQAEALGWLYAVGHGRRHVIAKARGGSAAEPATHFAISREAVRELADGLAPGLPYSTVVSESPAISVVGGIIDRAVLRIAGMSSRRHRQGHRRIRKVG